MQVGHLSHQLCSSSWERSSIYGRKTFGYIYLPRTDRWRVATESCNSPSAPGYSDRSVRKISSHSHSSPLLTPLPPAKHMYSLRTHLSKSRSQIGLPLSHNVHSSLKKELVHSLCSSFHPISPHNTGDIGEHKHVIRLAAPVLTAEKRQEERNPHPSALHSRALLDLLLLSCISGRR